MNDFSRVESTSLRPIFAKVAEPSELTAKRKVVQLRERVPEKRWTLKRRRSRSSKKSCSSGKGLALAPGHSPKKSNTSTRRQIRYYYILLF